MKKLLPSFSSESPENFLMKNFPVTCPIPQSREPEVGYYLDNMADGNLLHNALITSSDVSQVTQARPHDGLLVSLAQDLVDEKGYPLSLLRKSNIEGRRRFSFDPKTGNIVRFDVSFKDAGKSKLRREWEGVADSLHSGMDEAIAKLSVDFPHLAVVEENSFRIAGACLCARASTDYHMISSDGNVCFTVEANDDACVFTTPHADILLGYRKEKEFEITSIRFPKKYKANKDEAHERLDEGIDKVRGLFENSAAQKRIHLAEISKGGDITRRVSQFYEGHGIYPEMDGVDQALLQNVRGQDFYGKILAMQELAATIPSSYVLAQGCPDTNFNSYFPRNAQAIVEMKLTA